ncbi:hypothetical protein KSF_064230 [Reticulibacter mediterranei]|uniref:Uncharacterized protein n=1 Tax=Reticulibacter mediterranei TaxID=2778369 RepID=A0A8J3IT01_9CHLR|nr:hypothetical protein KSF_064230 [Reticulibacter mediterranei]
MDVTRDEHRRGRRKDVHTLSNQGAGSSSEIQYGEKSSDLRDVSPPFPSHPSPVYDAPISPEMLSQYGGFYAPDNDGKKYVEPSANPDKSAAQAFSSKALGKRRAAESGNLMAGAILSKEDSQAFDTGAFSRRRRSSVSSVDSGFGGNEDDKPLKSPERSRRSSVSSVDSGVDVTEAPPRHDSGFSKTEELDPAKIKLAPFENQKMTAKELASLTNQELNDKDANFERNVGSLRDFRARHRANREIGKLHEQKRKNKAEYFFKRGNLRSTYKQLVESMVRVMIKDVQTTKEPKVHSKILKTEVSSTVTAEKRDKDKDKCTAHNMYAKLNALSLFKRETEQAISAQPEFREIENAALRKDLPGVRKGLQGIRKRFDATDRSHLRAHGVVDIEKGTVTLNGSNTVIKLHEIRDITVNKGGTVLGSTSMERGPLSPDVARGSRHRSLSKAPSFNSELSSHGNKDTSWTIALPEGGTEVVENRNTRTMLTTQHLINFQTNRIELANGTMIDLKDIDWTKSKEEEPTKLHLKQDAPLFEDGSTLDLKEAAKSFDAAAMRNRQKQEHAFKQYRLAQMEMLEKVSYAGSSTLSDMHALLSGIRTNDSTIIKVREDIAKVKRAEDSVTMYHFKESVREIGNDATSGLLHIRQKALNDASRVFAHALKRSALADIDKEKQTFGKFGETETVKTIKGTNDGIELQNDTDLPRYDKQKARETEFNAHTTALNIERESLGNQLKDIDAKASRLVESRVKEKASLEKELGSLNKQIKEHEEGTAQIWQNDAAFREQEDRLKKQHINISEQTDLKWKQSSLQYEQSRLTDQQADLKKEGADLTGRRDNLKKEGADLNGEWGNLKKEEANLTGRRDNLKNEETKYKIQQSNLLNERVRLRGRKDTLLSREAGEDNTAELAETDGRLGKIREELKPIQEQLGKISERLKPVEERLGKIPGELKPVEERLGKIPGELKPVEERLGKIPGELKPVEERLGKIPGELKPAEDDPWAKLSEAWAKNRHEWEVFDIQWKKSRGRSYGELADRRNQINGRLADIEIELKNPKELVRERNMREHRRTVYAGMQVEIERRLNPFRQRERGYQEEETNLKGQQTDLNKEEPRLKGQQTDLKSEEGRLQGQQTNLKNEETRLQGQQTDLKNEEGRLKSEQTDLKSKASDPANKEGSSTPPADKEGSSTSAEPKATQARLTEIEERLGKISEELKPVEERLGKIPGELAPVEIRLGKIPGELASIEERLKNIPGELASIQDQLRENGEARRRNNTNLNTAKEEWAKANGLSYEELLGRQNFINRRLREIPGELNIAARTHPDWQRREVVQQDFEDKKAECAEQDKKAKEFKELEKRLRKSKSPFTRNSYHIRKITEIDALEQLDGVKRSAEIEKLVEKLQRVNIEHGDSELVRARKEYENARVDHITKAHSEAEAKKNPNELRLALYEERYHAAIVRFNITRAKYALENEVTERGIDDSGNRTEVMKSTEIDRLKSVRMMHLDDMITDASKLSQEQKAEQVASQHEYDKEMYRVKPKEFVPKPTGAKSAIDNAAEFTTYARERARFEIQKLIDETEDMSDKAKMIDNRGDLEKNFVEGFTKSYGEERTRAHELERVKLARKAMNDFAWKMFGMALVSNFQMAQNTFDQSVDSTLNSIIRSGTRTA